MRSSTRGWPRRRPTIARHPAPGAPLEAVDRLPERGMDPGAVLLALLGSANLASRHPVFHQYDSTVGADTVAGPGRGAAVLRVKGTTKALVATTDGNQGVGSTDPWLGAALSVAEATRNVSITGARPLGVTNCLNYGDPDATRGVLAADRGRSRAWRRVPGARSARDRRQRVALQRVADGRHRPDPGDRRGRPARRRRDPRRAGLPASARHGASWSASRRPAWPARPTPRWPVRPWRTARRGWTSPGRRHSRRSSARRSTAVWSRPRRTSPVADSPSPSRNRAMWGDLGATVRIADRQLARRRPVRREPVASGPELSAAVRRGARACWLVSTGCPVETVGSVGGDRLVVELAGSGATGASEERGSRVADALEVPLADLRHAWEHGLSRALGWEG